MARQPRLHVPGGLYHVTLRGNHRQPIFELPADRTRLDSIVADATERDVVRIHAYCWMTNHVHALVEISDVPLGRFMQRVASQYARFLQRRLETTGHLFERRYHAVLVDTERYLLELVRYIHLNPVRGGLVRDPAHYEWSSHRDYLGLARRPWVRPQRTLATLDPDLTRARLSYARLVAEALGTRLESPLKCSSSCDGRVLGDEEFLTRVRRAATGKRPQPMTLDELIDRTCAEHGVGADAVRSADRARHLSAVRVEIVRRALEEDVATRSEVARALGRTVAALSQASERARRGRKTGEPRPAPPNV